MVVGGTTRRLSVLVVLAASIPALAADPPGTGARPVWPARPSRNRGAYGAFAPSVTPNDIVRIHGGAGAPTEAAIQTIRAAPLMEVLSLEIRILDDPDVIGAIEDRLKRGGRVAALVDRNFFDRKSAAQRLMRTYPSSFFVRHLGERKGPVLFAHGKPVTSRLGALVSTATLDRASRGKNELAVELTGTTATILNWLVRQGVYGARLNPQLVEQARLHGIVMNDSEQGIRTLASTMEHLIKQARRGDLLHVAWSEQRDPALTQMLIDAHRAGVNVHIRVGRIGGHGLYADEPDLKMLTAAGIGVLMTRVREDIPYAHGNVLALERYATGEITTYVGSAFGWTPHVQGVGSRELGVVLSGPPARAAVVRQLLFYFDGPTTYLPPD